MGALRGIAFLYTSYNTGEQELYYLQADPPEVDNLAAATDAGTPAALAQHAYC
jgi:hypothetical protein